MQNAEALTKEQIQEFLNGSKGIEFSGGNRSERYSWVEQVLVAQEYAAQGAGQHHSERLVRFIERPAAVPACSIPSGYARRNLLNQARVRDQASQAAAAS